MKSDLDSPIDLPRENNIHHPICYLTHQWKYETHLLKTSPSPTVREATASAAAKLKLKYMVGVSGRRIHLAAMTMNTLTKNVRAQKKINTGVQIW